MTTAKTYPLFIVVKTLYEAHVRRHFRFSPFYSVKHSFTPLYTFRVYSSGSLGPVLMLLHGGGHSALSWAVFTVSFCHLTKPYLTT